MRRFGRGAWASLLDGSGDRFDVWDVQIIALCVGIKERSD